jgi:protein SCO1/2
MLLAIAGCGGSDETPKLKGMTDARLAGAGNVVLPAYGEGLSGRPRRLTPKQGRLMLVYFGYTSCPDVCPTSLSRLGAAVRTLPVSQQKQLEVAMVTADPRRDSGQKLVGYLEHFFRRQRTYGFRTPDMDRLSRAESAFGAASEIDPHKPGENYTVTHTAFIYAVDRNGRVRVMWPFEALSEEIASDLTVLLDERQPTPKTTT